MNDPLTPWEKMPDETAKAYEAFRRYRDLGPGRTVDQMQGVARTSAERWSTRYRWVARAQAWDSEVYRLEDVRRLDAIREMDQMHQQAARALITAGLRALAEAPKLTPNQAARFVDLGTRLQRSALTGEHVPAPPSLTSAGDDDMSPLERIARELAGTA